MKRISTGLILVGVWLIVAAGIVVAGTRNFNPPIGIAMFSRGDRQPITIDGDTAIIAGERIRILGMDAPELHPAHCAIERELGKAAKKMLADMLTGHAIIIDRKGIDRYGRTLALVTSDGRDVTTTMIAEQMAVPYDGRRRRIDWCKRVYERNE